MPHSPARHGAWCAAVFAVGVVLWLCMVGAPARAASFQVSPTRFEFSLERRFTNYFSVTNNSPEPLRIRVNTAYLDAGPDGGLVERSDGPYDLSPWLVLNPRRITLAPAERRVVRFSVRPPAGLSDGEYRAVVFFEELPPRPEDRAEAEPGFRIQILTRLGVTIYGRVGEPAPQPTLEQPSATVTAEAVQVAATLRNAGSAHATVGVTATLLDAGGTEQARGEQRITVQREQARPVALSMERPPDGAYTLRLEGTVEEQPVFTVDVPVTVEPAAR